MKNNPTDSIVSNKTLLDALSNEFWNGSTHQKSDISFNPEEEVELSPYATGFESTAHATPDVEKRNAPLSESELYKESHTANEIHTSSKDQREKKSAYDYLEINGVRITHVLFNQLKRLGMPAHWYTSGELKTAQLAVAADATLIDDPNGKNFNDRLRLDKREKEAANNNAPKMEVSEIDTTEAPKDMSSLIKECDHGIVFTGMKVLYDPQEVHHCDHTLVHDAPVLPPVPMHGFTEEQYAAFAR